MNIVLSPYKILYIINSIVTKNKVSKDQLIVPSWNKKKIFRQYNEYFGYIYMLHWNMFKVKLNFLSLAAEMVIIEIDTPFLLTCFGNILISIIYGLE